MSDPWVRVRGATAGKRRRTSRRLGRQSGRYEPSEQEDCNKLVTLARAREHHSESQDAAAVCTRRSLNPRVAGRSRYLVSVGSAALERGADDLEVVERRAPSCSA